MKIIIEIDMKYSDKDVPSQYIEDILEPFLYNVDDYDFVPGHEEDIMDDEQKVGTFKVV